MSCIIPITSENFSRYMDQMLAIERASFPSPWSTQAFREEVSNGASRLWVLVQDGRLKGYVCFWIFAGEIHLMNIAVDPKERGKGLGRKLMTGMINFGRSRGVTRVWLEVRTSNRTARRMYQKSGFRAVGRRPCYYRDTNEDAIVMSLSLATPEGVDRKMRVETGLQHAL